MNKIMKKLLCACLALAMLITIIPPVTAEAATKSLVLYKGEELQYTNYYTVKSVSSSKKSVISISKDKKKDYYANIKAKKTGKSTITIKTKYNTTKYNVTVKKMNFKVTYKQLASDKVLMCVKNNMKSTFEDVKFTYTLRDASGAVVQKKEIIVSDILPGKTSYTTISTYGTEVDASQCSAKFAQSSREPLTKYASLNSKVKSSVKEKNGDGYIEFSVKLKNNSKSSARGSVFMLLYDSDNNIIGLKNFTVYGLDAGNVKTEQIRVYNSSYSEFASYNHYKIIPALYSKK